MTAQELALLQGCHEDPTPAPKLVYADWLEDAGRPDLAHAYRWAAKRKRHPAATPQGRKAWWARHPKVGRARDRPEALPWIVFEALPSAAAASHQSGHHAFAGCMRHLSAALALMRKESE